MLVGVEVIGQRPRQLDEESQLSLELGDGRSRVAFGHELVTRDPLAVSQDPLTHVDVEAETQLRVGARKRSGAGGGRPPHHQTGAGDYAVLVGLDDSPVHAFGEPEVVGIDYQFRLDEDRWPGALCPILPGSQHSMDSGVSQRSNLSPGRPLQSALCLRLSGRLTAFAPDLPVLLTDS